MSPSGSTPSPRVEIGFLTSQGRKPGTAGELSLLLAVLFVGTDFVSVKYALEGIPPLVLVPLRYVSAGLLLVVLLRSLGRKVVVRRGDLLIFVGLALVGVTLNQIGYTVGLSLTSGSNAALIFATAPVWGLLLGVGLRMERTSVRAVGGLCLAVAGVALVVSDGLGSPEATLGGDLLVCLSALSWGAYAVLSMPVLRRYDALVVAAWTLLLGGLAAVPMAILGFPGLSVPLSAVDWGAVKQGSWLAVLYSTVLASGFAIAAWQVNVARLGANRVLVYMYVLTLVGLVSSVLLLGESLGTTKLLGAVVILFGVYLTRRS